MLVPKSLNAYRVEEFRPISCCNTVYKIISKILALRLSPILEKLIDPAQSAFVPNRSMVENIYMVQELLRKYSWKRISPRCILLHGFFKGKQGLRQGDPLSPFLFAICLEVLSRNMGRLGRNPHFNHHPKCSEMSITHLAFADDLILFTRGEVTSLSLSMECLKKFRDCSGLCINASKSNVYTAGICPEEMEEIKLITGFSIGEFPFRYLGIPVASSRLTTEQFRPLILKVSDCISVWAGASLSYAGRSELIKSVLQGIECFWLSIFPISVGVRDKIILLCRNFL